MGKASNPLMDAMTSTKAYPQGASRQRGAVPSSELVPLQFRMTPEFVRAFKQAALDHNMKLNELLNSCFSEFMKIQEDKV
jgi:hypothetical protein